MASKASIATPLTTLICGARGEKPLHDSKRWNGRCHTSQLWSGTRIEIWVSGNYQNMLFSHYQTHWVSGIVLNYRPLCRCLQVHWKLMLPLLIFLAWFACVLVRDIVGSPSIPGRHGSELQTQTSFLAFLTML